tara:strand:+ start:264 stop:464 length:201 start_codon:yes stop_codon:yes gene_type:complete
MIPVEGHKNLFRDEKSGAIVSTDTFGYSDYKRERVRKMDEKAELDDMKRDIEEIKSLLKELTGRIT